MIGVDWRGGSVAELCMKERAGGGSFCIRRTGGRYRRIVYLISFLQQPQRRRRRLSVVGRSVACRLDVNWLGQRAGGRAPAVRRAHAHKKRRQATSPTATSRPTLSVCQQLRAGPWRVVIGVTSLEGHASSNWSLVVVVVVVLAHSVIRRATFRHLATDAQCW